MCNKISFFLLHNIFQVDVRVAPGSHVKEAEGINSCRLVVISMFCLQLILKIVFKNAVNKQLRDKERMMAALENPSLMRFFK